MSEIDSLIRTGHSLFAQRRFAEALQVFGRVRQMAPLAALPLLNEAICLRELGREADARVVLERARDLAPGSLPILEHLGGVLKQTGRFEEALSIFESAMTAHPERVSLALDYVSCRRMTEADRPRLAKIFASADAGRLSAEEKISLHFAIAKFYDDVEDYETAIEHFEIAHEEAANQQRKSGRSYNRAQMESRFQAIVSTFSQTRLAKSSAASLNSARPLFVLGMVRSGTTLVEQILTRHSQIASGGELSFWPQNWQKLKPTASGFADADIKALGSAYLTKLNSIDSKATMVTDKMPGNYIALGSIHTVFPRAKVIYCKRKPIDNCVSIYTTPFRSGHEWIHKREDIVSYYRLHENLMEHWRSALPSGVMLEVQYERLVTEPESVTREMIEFIGLPWENSCLSPEDNDRPVLTPSQWQVRQPVYRSSVDRWKHYIPWLGALIELLPRGEGQP